MDNHINCKLNLKLKTHKHISNHLHKPSLEPPPLKERTQHDPASPPLANPAVSRMHGRFGIIPPSPHKHIRQQPAKRLCCEKGCSEKHISKMLRSTMKFHKIIQFDPLNLYPPCVIPQFRDSFQKRRPQSSNTDSLERIPRKHVVQTKHVGQKLN